MKKIKGNKQRPRLSVFRSGKKIYAQVIDDRVGKTLVAASEKEIKDLAPKADKTAKAEALGGLLAQKAKKKGIKKVVFDRRGYRYHGRVKALAQRARKEGLTF